MSCNHGLAESSAIRKLLGLLSDRWINAEKLFEQVDVDHSDIIDLGELYNCLKQMGFAQFANEYASKLFNEIDVDKDGEITKEEFVTALRALGSDSLDDVLCLESLQHMPGPPIRPDTKYVALVAHNNLKAAMVRFVAQHREWFGSQALVTTGSTGRSLEGALKISVAKKVKSGPLGGDQEIGAMIAQEQVAVVFFLRDPMDTHAHMEDIGALLRLCDTHQVPHATNISTARALMFCLKQNGIGWFSGSNKNVVVEKYDQQQQQKIAEVVKAAQTLKV